MYAGRFNMAIVRKFLLATVLAIMAFLAFCLNSGAGENHKTVPVKVTAYTLFELKDSEGITASGKEPKVGYVAISRDLEKKHGLSFGDRVYLKGLGVFEIQDRTHFSKTNLIDIYMESYRRALEFGIRELEMVFRKKH
jgi:3D (Asp-Asp-Asp) domain-containing protein